MWLAIATILAAIITVFGTDYLRNKRSRKQINDLHQKLGNGFASEVVTSLDKLTIDVGALKKRMNQHINQHAQGAFASNEKGSDGRRGA